jgi:hypothetical protein
MILDNQCNVLVQMLVFINLALPHWSHHNQMMIWKGMQKQWEKGMLPPQK